MNKRVTVTELVAFINCEKKALLIQQGKKQNHTGFDERTAAQKGTITHAIIERKNRA